MVVPAPLAQTFQGGQMTDLPEYDAGFDPTALMEIVSPGNEEAGVNYSITLALLASYLVQALYTNTIITSGATIGDHYEVASDEYRIIVKKTVASASYIDIGSGADRTIPVLIIDGRGDADVNNITVSFSGTCNGLASPIVMTAPYGGWVFNPLADGNWFLTSA